MVYLKEIRTEAFLKMLKYKSAAVLRVAREEQLASKGDTPVLAEGVSGCVEKPVPRRGDNAVKLCDAIHVGEPKLAPTTRGMEYSVEVSAVSVSSWHVAIVSASSDPLLRMYPPATKLASQSVILKIACKFQYRLIRTRSCSHPLSCGCRAATGHGAHLQLGLPDDSPLIREHESPLTL